MMQCLLLVGLVCGAQTESKSPASPPAESPPASPSLPTEVRRLVQQLDDASQGNRDRAEKDLTALGPDVLSLLPAVTPRTPAETKERLGRIRATLELQLSQATARPSAVTLTGKMPLARIFQALEQQTGNRVVGYERRGGRGDVNVDFAGIPYWQALDQLLDQAGLTINPYGGEPKALVVAARPDGEMPRAGRGVYSGVFRFEAVRVEARRDLRNPAADGMRVAVSVTWEPRITPITLRQPMDRIVALDEEGTPLAVGRSDSQSVLNATGEVGMSAIELGIPLKLPERRVRKIATLKGTLTALVPGRLESFEFTDLANLRDAEQQRAGVTVTFERLRKNGDVYEVRLRVRYDEAANALESHRGWIFTNPAYVLDAAGQRIENLGSNEGSRDEQEIGLVCLFDLPKGPQGCRFVYQTPASLLQLPIDYELKDIVLP